MSRAEREAIVGGLAEMGKVWGSIYAEYSGRDIPLEAGSP